jgi:7,8-dihydro-6-hydroxymethylpterin-pyrophosphokinase
MSERAAIALGSNIEDPEAQVTMAHARAAGQALPGYDRYYTAGLNIGTPWASRTSHFINAVAVVEPLAPRAAERAAAIERPRPRAHVPNGPRTLDSTSSSTDRTLGPAYIPHPRARRAFV